MKLVANWRAVLARAWSVRLLAAAAILSGLEVALPLLRDVFPLDPGIFAALSGACTAGALVARIVAQKNISGDDA